MSKLSRFSSKTAAKKTAKSYPVIDDKELGALAAFVAEKDELVKSLTGILKSYKAQLRDAAFPIWNKNNIGKAEPTTSVVIKTWELVEGAEEPTRGGTDLMVTFQEGYRSGVEREELDAAIGKDLTKDLFEDKWSLTIDSTSIDEAKQDALVEGLVALCESLDIDPNVITSKELTVPKKGFHKVRGIKLTESQNKTIDGILKTPALVKRRPA